MTTSRIRATLFLTTHHPIIAAWCNLKTRDGIDNENVILALTHLLEDVRIQERLRIRKCLCQACDAAERRTRPQ